MIPGGGGDTGTGAVGTVAEIEADIITLNTPTGTAWVLITDSTTIQMMGEGSLDDISPGQNVTVSGEMGDDGAIEATTVFISPDIKGLGGVGRKQR